MNNIEVLISWSISIIKKSSLFIATILSLFSSITHTYSNSNMNPIDPGIPVGISNYAKKQAVENTDKIIGVLNQDNLTILIPVDKNTKKLNTLTITAPTYKNIKTNVPNSANATNTAGFQNTKTTKTIEKKNVFITKINTNNSVVNIRCENKTSNTLKVLTGSGVLISSSGLILTAAHVAAPVYAKQNGDNSYDCIARIGNPATGNYPLKIVFIDPAWISKYYSVFDKAYSETGENDVALLQIDNNTNNTAGIKISDTDIIKLNNTSYAFLSLVSTNTGNTVTIKAYPSDVYGKFGVFSVLPRQSEINYIEGVFNFNGDVGVQYDLLETGPSSLGQSGASGGGIFNDQGQLVGIISNVISSDILLKNKIRALSLSYIDKRFKSNLGKSIFEYND